MYLQSIQSVKDNAAKSVNRSILKKSRHRVLCLYSSFVHDSAAKLKRSQLIVCTVYVYCVLCTLFPSVAETFARLAGNFCQYLTTVKPGANSMVWVAVCYLTASYSSRAWEGWGVGQLCLHSVTQPYNAWPRWR
jgi:hypothetical protein